MERLKTITIIFLLAIGLLVPAALAKPASRLAGKPASVLLREGLYAEETEGDLDAAIQVYERVLKDFPKNRPVAAKALLHIGLCYEKLGKQEAQKAYRRLIKEFADQHDVAAQARMQLVAMERDNGKPEVTVRKAWDSIQGVMDKNMAISPDGRYLSFCNLENGNLAVRDLATGENRDITDDATWYGAQSHTIRNTWSPDGKQVVCQWSGGGHSGLRIVGLDGSQPRDLYNNTVKSAGPWVGRPYDWSKDGKYILVSLVRKIDENKEVWGFGLVSVADGSVRTLKSPAGNLASQSGMKFSPDGRYVAYSSEEPKEHTDVFLLAIDGSGKEVRLTEHPASDFNPAWAPDGKAIVFVSDRDPGGMGLWIRYLVDGKPVGEPQLVKREAGKVLSLGFTRKGSLFYTTETSWSHIYTASLDMETGKVLAPPTLLLRSEGFNIQPAWSPDGKSLAYLSDRASLGEFGRRSILVINSVETGEERVLLTEWWLRGRINWSPDGRSILYGNYHDPLRLIDVKTGHITEIAKTDTRILGRAWSPDGKTIYYIGKNVRNEVGDWPSRIVALDLETRQERELYARNNTGKFLAVSPDGRQLAFSDIVFLGGTRDDNTSYDARLKVIPTAGGEPRTLFNLRNQDLGLEENDWLYGPLAWTPDGRHLLFGRVNKSTGLPPIGSFELWRIPVEGGEPQKLMEIESPLGLGIDTTHLSLHPDGKRIAFHKGESSQKNLWVMENLLSKFKAGE